MTTLELSLICHGSVFVLISTGASKSLGVSQSSNTLSSFLVGWRADICTRSSTLVTSRDVSGSVEAALNFALLFFCRPGSCMDALEGSRGGRSQDSRPYSSRVGENW